MQGRGVTLIKGGELDFPPFDIFDAFKTWFQVRSETRFQDS